MAGVGISLDGLSNAANSDSKGNWKITGVKANKVLSAVKSGFTFSPATVTTYLGMDTVVFQQKKLSSAPSANAIKLNIWMQQQQTPQGFMRSSFASPVVSLYDNALAALVFISQGDFNRAERIFDYFNGRIDSELLLAPGGFSQFRDLNGNPDGHSWLGDNAWLLIALNAYSLQKPNNTAYNRLKFELAKWIKGLQNTNGGLYSGYDGNTQLNFEVTEGMLDAFHAVPGYDNFHSGILRYLKNNRWDASLQRMLCDPNYPKYKYSLDNYSWGYAMLPGMPASYLDKADIFYCTKVATANGATISGYCFDIDLDNVWPEGTGQMAVSYQMAGNFEKANQILAEMDKLVLASPTNPAYFGIPYASNKTTHYATSQLWDGADTEPTLSSAAWYLMAAYRYNPYLAERNKVIPLADVFWD